MNQAEVYKKKIRRETMKISVSLISFYVVYLIVAVASMLIFLAATGKLGILFGYSTGLGGTSIQGVENDILSALPLGWISIVSLFVGSLMLLIVRGKRLYTKDLTKTNNRIDTPDFLKMAGLILGINAAITLVSLLFSLFSESLGNSTGSDAMELFFRDYSGVLYVVLLGPVLEEIIFRGAVLRSLEPFGQNFAIVVSSLLFGLYHLMLFQGVFAFFIGLVLAYCAIRFSIKWAILLHILNNGFATVLSYLGISEVVQYVILAIMLALGLLSLVFGFKKLRQQMKSGKPTELYFAVGIPIVPYYLSPADPRIAPYIASAMTIRAKPYHLAFSSAWLIVVLSLATIITLLMTFVM